MERPQSSLSQPAQEDDLTALRQALGISDEAATRIQRVVVDSGQPWTVVVARLGLAEDIDVARALATRHNLTFVDRIEGEAPALPRTPPSAFLRSRRVLPWRLNGGALEAIVADPSDHAALKALAFSTGVTRIIPAIAPIGELEAALERIDSAASGPPAEIDFTGLAHESETHDAASLRDLADQAPIIRLVDQLFNEASALGASDIHLEPAKDHCLVRVRVDGVLRQLRRLPRSVAPAAASRIKVLGGMDVANRRSPQDGRAAVAIRGRPVDIRISTAPGLHGETVAIRLLDREAVRLDLDQLGFSSVARGVMEGVLQRTSGLVLITGPTGHGKTTTLYALLRRLTDGSRKILTVEDPVEYELDGVTQVQVNEAAGVSFASALRSFLRQDPDVILIGEIRDGETARIAVQAALTGHLVLATLHTNDAPSVAPRLQDMGVDPYLIGATLSAVVAQRLIRRLCVCATALESTALEMSAIAAQTGDRTPISARRPVGCAACGQTGFQGRAAIAEAVVIDDADKAALRTSDAVGLATAWRSRGFRSLMGDGAERAAAGETTWTEILRVAG